MVDTGVAAVERHVEGVVEIVAVAGSSDPGVPIEEHVGVDNAALEVVRVAAREGHWQRERLRPPVGSDQTDRTVVGPWPGLRWVLRPASRRFVVSVWIANGFFVISLEIHEVGLDR